MEQRGIITSVEIQKKQKHRYNIYIDDVFAFGVHEDVLMKHQLFKGKAVESEVIAEVLRDEERQQAYLKVIRWLGTKPRTAKEIRAYLKRKEFDESIIDECVERLQKERYVDDQRLSMQLLEERLKLHGKGKHWIRQELVHKGIDKALVQDAIASVSIEDETQSALTLARKRWKTLSKGDDRNAAIRKLYGYLARRGYSSSVVRSVIRDASGGELDDEEFGETDLDLND